MHLKLYLNKYLKADNIEYYTLTYLFALRKEYEHFLDLTGGYDPDFPNINIGDRKNGQKIQGKNKIQLEKNSTDGINDFPDEFDRVNDYQGQNNNSSERADSGMEEILNLHK